MKTNVDKPIIIAFLISFLNIKINKHIGIKDITIVNLMDTPILKRRPIIIDLLKFNLLKFRISHEIKVNIKIMNISLSHT